MNTKLVWLFPKTISQLKKITLLFIIFFKELVKYYKGIEFNCYYDLVMSPISALLLNGQINDYIV